MWSVCCSRGYTRHTISSGFIQLLKKNPGLPITFREEKYSLLQNLVWNILSSFQELSVILLIKINDNATAWTQWIPIGRAIPVYKQLNWTKLLTTRVIALEYYLILNEINSGSTNKNLITGLELAQNARMMADRQ